MLIIIITVNVINSSFKKTSVWLNFKNLSYIVLLGSSSVIRHRKKEGKRMLFL